MSHKWSKLIQLEEDEYKAEFGHFESADDESSSDMDVKIEPCPWADRVNRYYGNGGDSAEAAAVAGHEAQCKACHAMAKARRELNSNPFKPARRQGMLPSYILALPMRMGERASYSGILDRLPLAMGADQSIIYSIEAPQQENSKIEIKYNPDSKQAEIAIFPDSEFEVDAFSGDVRLSHHAYRKGDPVHPAIDIKNVISSLSLKIVDSYIVTLKVEA
ncbi:MAG: hypothetical protein LBU32_03915 [Clostridiales bacterium]|jgi:hypothetical protein|nr:hypothetical protein [Clostridiales bacterium]